MSVLGLDPERGDRELREQIGIVLQDCGVQKDLTVAELVDMYAAATRPARPVDEVIELVGLDEKRDGRGRRSCPAASGGGWTWHSALVGDPELIFLDEPTTGFDPAARRHAWSTIRRCASSARPCS